MRRRLDLLLLAVLLLLAATAVQATDYTLANGDVHFTAPASWPLVMQAKGDPEMMAFQVPDPSPTGDDTLARITVTSTKAADITGFQQYVAERIGAAHSQPSFQEQADQSGPTWIHYTAVEGNHPQTYIERYYFKNGHALQLRCIRPTHSKAGAEWTAAFDRGCDAIAAELK